MLSPPVYKNQEDPADHSFRLKVCYMRDGWTGSSMVTSSVWNTVFVS
jgi:hypothetical protein